MGNAQYSSACSRGALTPAPPIGHPPLLQVVNFDQAHSRGVILSAHDGGVVAWRQGREDGMAPILRTRQ
jgi:hypothetical protein